jgi:hypothetical protein
MTRALAFHRNATSSSPGANTSPRHVLWPIAMFRADSTTHAEREDQTSSREWGSPSFLVNQGAWDLAEGSGV